MHRILLVALAGGLLSGCFDTNNSGTNPNTPPGATATPAPSASPAPTASPAPGPGATPAPTPAPSASPSPGRSPAPPASPSPSPTSTPGAGGASACFNPELLQQGTQSALSYRATDGDSGEVLNFTDERMVTGPTSFNGQQTIRTDGTTDSSSSAGNYSTQTETFSSMEAAAMRFRSYGVNTSTTVSGFTVTTRSTIEPAMLSRYDLAAGQSHSQSYTVTTVTDTGGFGSTTTVVNTDETTTYVGRETVTVPVGSFDTCRFDSSYSRTVDGSTATETASNWFEVGSGVLIRNMAEGDRTEFTGGTLNGTPVQ